MKKLLQKPWFAPLAVSLVILLLSIGTWLLLDGVHIPVLMPSGEVANAQRDLFIFTVLLSLIVIVPVFFLLTWFAWNYRSSKKNKKYTPEWSESARLEVIWWGIPILIIILLSIVTFVTSHSLDPYRPIESNNDTLEVEVVALQWKWLFIYPDNKVATINDLTVPVNTPVHFRLSADAPMSAFWIPDLGGQIYSMNAMSSQLNLIANKTGEFRGYNTNINGEGYAKMEFTVNAVTDDEFDAWQSKHKNSQAKLNHTSYLELAKPSVPDNPQYFALADPDIYDTIIAKYMNHDGVDHQHGLDHGAPEPFDEAIDENLRQEDLKDDVDRNGGHRHHEGVHD